MKQIVQLIKQNKFYSVMSIIGTAITIAYVMVVWMVYIFQTDDIEPEGKRSRTITVPAVVFYPSDNPKSKDASGMNEWTIEEIFSDLPGVEMITVMNNNWGDIEKYIKDNYERVDICENLVNENVWKQYNYKFLEGRPYTKEEVESGMAVAVITKNAAAKLFGTFENVIGKEIKPEFADKKYKVIGMVDDISPVFPRAFSEVWRPIELYKNRDGYIPQGPSGKFFVSVILEKGVNKKDAIEAIKESLRKYNLAHKDYVLEFQFKHFREWGMENSTMMYLFIICIIFMILPIVNSIGLVSSHMSKRLSEIGVRKAYGASKGQIIRQLIAENLVTTLIGAFFGLILASIALWSARSWILESMWNSYSEVTSVPISAFLNIKVFLCTILFCLILNFLSIYGPARRVSKKAICETIKGEIK